MSMAAENSIFLRAWPPRGRGGDRPRNSRFRQRPYGNGISLPCTATFAESLAISPQQYPFFRRPRRCPYMREIFDGFQTDKATFRLLRCGPQTAYSFHDDRDKGQRVARFQISFATMRRHFR